MRTNRMVCLLVGGLLVSGCGPDPHEEPPSPTFPAVRVDIEARRPAEFLSDYRLFKDLENQIPNDGVLPYELNTPHYVDGGRSRHYLHLPPGGSATYAEEGPFGFPMGTVLVQTLSFPKDARNPDLGERLLETRLLIHQSKGWVAVPYLWNEQGTDAERVVVGDKSNVSWIDSEGSERAIEFITPDMNECKRCHKHQDTVTPLGTTARNLNRTGGHWSHGRTQLAFWSAVGILEGLPKDPAAIPKGAVWNDPESGPVEERARVWLEVNCAHCHNPDGEANTSGLDLSHAQTHPAKFGVYKPPVAAGRGSGGYRFGIEPGKPERSFLLHRIRSVEPGVMMPSMGRSTIDEDGAHLIEEWISGMEVDSELEARALDPMQAYQGSLSGGDSARGRVVFYETFKCVACHTIEGEGEGAVGPNLSDVGARLDREKILEALVDPSASIAEGYETTLVVTEDEEFFSGILLSEDANEVVLSNSTGGRDSIPKSAIGDRRTSDLSSMPSVANLLSVEEVADLIQYLSERTTPSK